ncbi:MAG: hypothetical protein AAGJ93_11895 [Bacteroidota bacterium]
MDQLDKVNSLVFHDGVLLKITFIFDECKLKLTYEIDSIVISVSFMKVSNLSFGDLVFIDKLDDVEIYNASFQQLSPGLLKANFTFLLGFGKPSWDFDFTFRHYMIEEN